MTVELVHEDSSFSPSTLAADVRRGLTRHPKALPPYLFYDAAGSELYEQITRLPEYYLTRAEAEIISARASDIVQRIARRETGSLRVVELGAGTATKTQDLLQEVVRRLGRSLYIPVDISASALAEAERRLRRDVPGLAIQPLVMAHERALHVLRDITSPCLVLFIGSSVGNLTDDEAKALLGRVRVAFRGSPWLVLGTDLRKSPRTMLPAYDDAEGVTAAFNKNVLTRINRELGADFDLDCFRHVARWNEATSAVEMHLESVGAQWVTLRQLGMRVRFADGETIHTESSAKYDLPRVERLLSGAGFALETTYFDAHERFALHLARGR
jgi:dimethylhistidine N-methyltransferase